MQRPSVIKLLCLYLFWFFLPFILQIVLSQVPFIKDYYFSPNYGIIKSFAGDFINFGAIGSYLLLSLVPGLLAAYLSILSSKFRMFLLIAGPLFGLFLIYVSFSASNQPCYSFDCFSVMIFQGLVAHYWQMLVALLPLVWALRQPASGFSEIARRTVLPGLILMIIIGIAASVWSLPRVKEMKESLNKQNAQVEEYKSKMTYYAPTYFPKRAGNVMNESVVESSMLSVTGTDSNGVDTTYSCRGDTKGYQYFHIVQAPLDKVKTIEDLHHEYTTYYPSGESAFDELEMVQLENGQGVYKQFQMSGASDAVGAGLQFDLNNTRIALLVFENCLDNPENIKEELIKIANSFK